MKHNVFPMFFCLACLFFGFSVGYFLLEPPQPEPIYITVTQVVEVPVEVVKEKIVIFFGHENEEDYLLIEPTPEPITDEYRMSGDWSGLPMDQNSDGMVTCADFKGDTEGLDNLLDLAYNRYGAKYLDWNGDGIPCNEQ